MFWARARMLRRIDVEQVRQAIAAAERQTSGRVRVSLAPWFWGDVRRAAERAFTRLGRHGVLIFVVPGRRKFVVLGDEDVHAHVGQDFWDDVAAAMADLFRAGDFTGGLVHGIETAGRELAAVYPCDAAAAGAAEAPDEVDIE
jgi:uncharacterized membrane protein